jgi:hypothetical protein
MSRILLRVLPVVVLTVLLVECSASPTLQSIQVIPNGAALTFVGQTLQFKAIGTYLHGTHPTVTRDITSQVTWASSNSDVSTISASGLATATDTGATVITASMNSGLGAIVGTSDLNVSGDIAHDLQSIAVIPGSNVQIVSSIGEPTQFIAIGTFNTSPVTLDLTDQVSWQSSDVKVATINSAGLALANATGTTTITAIGKSTSGAAIPGTSTLTVGAGGGVTLPLLSVYDVGLGAGTVTSSPAGISCTSGAGCTGNFVLGSTVTLTAAPAAGSTFGGWSANCTPDTATSCTIVMNNNEPVGAIFN